MSQPSNPLVWTHYWALRRQVERHAVAILDAQPAVADVLMEFLEGHCFGCGQPVAAEEEELCERCRRRQVWARN